MTWASNPGLVRTALLWAFGLSLFALTALLQAQDTEVPVEARSEARSEAWLITYGPGEIYWQRFGHNAIWIRDSERRLDHVFNFGFFDFEQENFLLRFIQGRMLYFSAAHPAEQEFSQYVGEGRSIRAQQLNLTLEQLENLTRYLLGEIQPESRDYLYDYYFNNCSTRVRDALDTAFDGRLSDMLINRPAAQNLRQHTRRSTSMAPLFHLGLEIGLGSPIDRPINAWDEMFLPAELADALSEAVMERDSMVQPLVVEDVMLVESELSVPGNKATSQWLGYLWPVLAVLLLVWLLSIRVSPLIGSVATSLWLVMAGLVGVVLVYFWIGTDHEAAGYNLNLLLFNPVWLLVAFFRSKLPAVSVAVLILLPLSAVLAFVLFAWQYNLNVIAVAVPIHLAVAAAIAKAAGLGQVREKDLV